MSEPFPRPGLQQIVANAQRLQQLLELRGDDPDFKGDFSEVISMVKKDNIDCLVETGTMDFYDFPYIRNNME